MPGGGKGGGGVRVSVCVCEVGGGVGEGEGGGVDRDGVRTWIVSCFIFDCIHSCHSISDQLHPCISSSIGSC